MRRGEWSALLVTALLALLAGSPSAGAALTASSASASCEAVLWLLHASAEQASPLELQPLQPQQIEAILATFENSRPVSFSTVAEITRPTLTEPEKSSPSTPVQFAPDVCSYPPLTAAPRYDATRRLATRSLSAHEAGARSGIRTNRFHE